MAFPKIRFRTLRKTLKSEKPAPDSNIYHTLPSTSTAPQPTTAFDFVSDFVILQILKSLDVHELLKVRLVSKRLNNIVQRHSEQLAKVERSGFVLIGLPGDKTSFLGASNYEPQDVAVPIRHMDQGLRHVAIRDAPQDVAVPIRHMDQGLRHVAIRDAVTVEGVHMDYRACQMMQRSFRCHIPKLEIYGGQIDVDSATFCKLVCRWNVSDLSVGDLNVSRQLIDDRFFRVNRQLRNFSAAFSDKQMLPALTDATLEKWWVNENWPSTLVLKNCQTSITNDGIIALVKGLVYFARSRALTVGGSCDSEPILWDFGIICDSQQEMVKSVNSLFPNTASIVEEGSELLVLVEENTPIRLKIAYYPRDCPHSDSDC
uniref:F-box domain-containing protein n=1 Tax=Steinernema glaseri TaxID=37863 RepID=A0A1I7YA80_9BILA